MDEKTAEKEYVYCSGPLFCPEEIGGMTAIAELLESEGYGTFLPHRDGLEAHLLKHVNSPLGMNVLRSRELADRLIFALDLYQVVRRCDYLVANMNGRVPDEGAVAEAAVAFAVGKPVIIYKNDCRTAFSGRDNSMVTGLACQGPVSRLKDIPKALCKANRKFEKKDRCSSGDFPPPLESALALGQRVWKVMTMVSSGALGDADRLVREIADFCLAYNSDASLP